MNLFLKIKRCPCCRTINLIKVNGITYTNKFQSISEWVLKKIFNCKKCKEKLGLFTSLQEGKEKVIWLEHFKYSDDYFNDLFKLQIKKEKSKKFGKKYFSILKEIENIRNTISLNQTKLKIKFKIQNRGM